jgi:hypothetical protein
MSDCSCVYCEPDSYPEPYTQIVRTARKTHICTECGSKIKPGDKYENFTGKWNGGFDTYKTCPVCLELREAFFCMGYFYEQVLEFLWEHIRDVGGQIDSDCLLELSPKARYKVFDMIEEYWEDD